LSLPFSLSTLCKLRCTSCKKRANHRITNPTLLIAIAFLAGGFAAINKFAPEPVQFGDRTITQKHLYIGLFVIGKLSPTGDIVPGTDDQVFLYYGSHRLCRPSSGWSDLLLFSSSVMPVSWNQESSQSTQESRVSNHAERKSCNNTSCLYSCITSYNRSCPSPWAPRQGPPVQVPHPQHPLGYIPPDPFS
jgi:hypothetical protein